MSVDEKAITLKVVCCSHHASSKIRCGAPHFRTTSNHTVGTSPPCGSPDNIGTYIRMVDVRDGWSALPSSTTATLAGNTTTARVFHSHNHVPNVSYNRNIFPFEAVLCLPEQVGATRGVYTKLRPGSHIYYLPIWGQSRVPCHVCGSKLKINGQAQHIRMHFTQGVLHDTQLVGYKHRDSAHLAIDGNDLFPSQHFSSRLFALMWNCECMPYDRPHRVPSEFITTGLSLTRFVDGHQ